MHDRRRDGSGLAKVEEVSKGILKPLKRLIGVCPSHQALKNQGLFWLELEAERRVGDDLAVLVQVLVL